MVHRGLGTAEGGVDAADLPVADGQVARRTDRGPVQPARVRGVDELLVVRGRAVGLLEQLPHAVEQRDGERALGRRVELAAGDGVGHGGLLVVQGRVDEVAEVVDHTVEAGDPGTDPVTVPGEELSPSPRVVASEHLADLLERHLEVAQGRDRPCRLELIARVAAVRRRLVDRRRHQQPDAVVVAQRPDGQAAQAGELADAQTVVSGRGHPRILHVEDSEVSGSPRVKRRR